MSLARKHSLWAVEFNATLVGGITAQRVYMGNEVRVEPTAGEVYARHAAFVARRPGATFTSVNIAALLAQVPAMGLDIATLAAAAANGVRFYAQKHLDGGGRATGANHRRYEAVKGIAVLRTLTCDFGGDAALSGEVLATYDGSNDPVVETDAASLPAGITDAQRFTLGPITIGGVLLTQFRSLSIDFGLTVELDGADSDIFPTFASIMAVRRRITARGLDVEWLKSTNIPRAGIVCTHANTKIYLRKRTQDTAHFVVDGTAEHIKFTAAGLAHIDEAMNAQGSRGAESSLVVDTQYDGTNDPITVNTASAIT